MSNYSQKAHDVFFNKGKKGKHKEPVFNLRIPESDKYANDGEWFKDYAEYIVPVSNSTIEEYNELKLAYEVYNDNLEGFKKEFDRFCNPMGENVGQIDEEIRPQPKIHNNVNVLKGELLKRNDVHKIVLLTAKAIRKKNQKLIEAIKASVEEELALEIEKMQLAMQGASEQEINKYVESLRTQATPEDLLQKNFLSEQEIFYSKALKYCKYDQRIKSKELETLEDAVCADRFFIYSGWKYGKPYLEIRNTLYSGFHKDPNEKFVNKGDYFWYKKPITIAQVYNEYGHLLSDDDIQELGIHTYSNNYRIDKRHSLGPNEHQYVFDQSNQEIFTSLVNNSALRHESKLVGTHQGNGMDKRFNNERLIWETHIEFKAYRELIFLSYTDEYNEPVTLILSNEFDIPEDAIKEEYINQFNIKNTKYTWYDELQGTTFEAEKLWIPRKYEVVRLGNSVYPVMREVPFQHTNIESPYSSFSLSTFGAILTSRNAKSISLVQRAIPPYFQYLYVDHIQKRELSKYQGYIQSIDVDQIPKQLGMDVDGNLIKDPIAVHALYMKRLGRDYYSGTQTTNSSLPPSTRSPGSRGYILGTAADIYNLQQLKQLLEIEIGMAMGISPQRLSQFSSGSNVTDNRQAITQSHHITEPYFYYIKEVWGQALLDYLKNFRTYCKNYINKNKENPVFHYVLPNGSEELFEVTPPMLEPVDLGIYVSNSQADVQYNETMLQLVHAFGQNAGEGMESVSSLLKSITQGSSPEETHKLISVEAQKQQERLQALEEQKLKVQEEYLDRQRQVREDNQAHEIDKIHVDRQYDVEIEKMQQLNNDNQLEREKLEHKKQVDNKKLNLEEKKIKQNKN